MSWALDHVRSRTQQGWTRTAIAPTTRNGVCRLFCRFLQRARAETRPSDLSCDDPQPFEYRETYQVDLTRELAAPALTLFAALELLNQNANLALTAATVRALGVIGDRDTC